MPRVTRWFIKAGMIYLAASLLLAAFQAFPSVSFPTLMPAIWHLLLVGWITHIIFGVAFWMFPRNKKTKRKESEPLAWWTFGLLTVGLLLRVFIEPLLPQILAGSFWRYALAASSFMQWAAACCFVVMVWPRVRGRRKRRKKTKS